MPSASFLFLLFSISEKLLLEIILELHENLRGIFIRQMEDIDQRAAWGATHRPGATFSRGQRWGRGQDPPLGLEAPLGSPRRL